MLEEEVQNLVIKYLNPSDKLLVAVSGGADSICLAHILWHLNIPMVICHFNHNLRKKESLEEQILVDNFSKKLNIPFYHQIWKNPPHNISEEKCRIKRYQFLDKTRKKHNCQFIATGHHLNDQIETMFFNFIRGTSFRGLRGIQICDHQLYRPLLRVSKTEILEYCRQHNLIFCVSSDNQSIQYSRNRLRHQIFPEIEKINPQFKKTLSHNQFIYEEIVDFFDKITQDWLSKYFIQKDNNTSFFPLSEWKNLHPALQKNILKSLLKKNASSQNILDLSKFIKQSKTGQKYIFEKLVFINEYQNIRIIPKRYLDYPTLSKTKLYNGLNIIINSLYRLTIKNKKLLINQKPYSINLAKTPLWVRSWRSGDKIKLQNGHQKLQDYFINNKIPRWRRKFIPIIVDKNEKIVIVGVKN